MNNVQGLSLFEFVRYAPEIPSEAVQKTVVCFDPYHECLWSGNEEGRITCHLMPTLDRHVSFKTHSDSPIRQLKAHQSGILGLGRKSLRLISRSGIPLWSFQEDISSSGLEVEPLINYHCMEIPVPNFPNQLLLAGEHSNMTLVDLYQGALVRKMTIGDGNPGTVVMKRHKLICCGQIDGKICLRDPFSLKVEHCLNAHSGTLSDLVISNHLLVTCGFSERNGQLLQDPILRVFDLRMYKALPFITFPQGAYMLQGHPKIPNIIYAMTQSGHVQSCDLGTLMVEPRFYQIDTSDYYCSAFDISSTGDFMAFGLGSGGLHVWANNENGMVNSYSHPMESAPKKPPIPTVEIQDDITPLSVIGMPYYDEPLLSVWPNDLIFTVGKRPPEIPPEILATVRKIDNILYAPNPGLFRRNQQNYRRKSDPKDDTPKFRSEQEREGLSIKLDSLTFKRDDFKRDPLSGITIPKSYRRVEIKYSRFGVEDFDFAFYNKTKFGGLETHISNAYSNALLQVWYHCKPIKNLTVSHLYSTCQNKLCIICELGFLFKMLDDSNGANCHASNFLRALRLHPKASSYEILESENGLPHLPFGLLLQRFSTFLLQVFQDEIRLDGDRNKCCLVKTSKIALSNPPPRTSLMNQLFGVCMDCSIRCACGNFERRSLSKLTLELNYPKKNVSFTKLLASSIMQLHNGSGKSFCSSCRKYQHKNVKRELVYLPPVLNIHCNIQNEDDLSHWRVGNVFQSSYQEGAGADEAGKSWLPMRIAITLKNNEVHVQKLSHDLLDYYNKTHENYLIYDLTASVCQVLPEFNVYSKKNHFVSLIRFSHESLMGMGFESPETPTSSYQFKWMLFNDFLVAPRPMTEASQYNCLWKIPCILQYTRVEMADLMNEEAFRCSRWPLNVLVPDITRLPLRVKENLRFESLSGDELCNLRGFKCALDAEFVMISPEETEVRSDGTKSIVRPSRRGLARLSVIRGEGPKIGIPFIDDYIVMTEPVFDYLTAFSGINPSDLNKDESFRYLTDLKTTYRKLRVLIDMECKFIGHGLKNDFRTINVVIPRERVFDTLEIFHKPKQRNISLKFLSWYLFRNFIQKDTHCSIEDSQTALAVYNEYLRIVGEEEGGGQDQFSHVLDDIYTMGRRLNWTIPTFLAQDYSQ